MTAPYILIGPPISINTLCSYILNKKIKKLL
jgi:hypothetical protein